jgi:superfamily II DNA or RNA helicase
MSQAQNKDRWQPPATLTLREGQRQIIDLLNDPNSRPRRERQLIAVLPTGYGKTLGLCCSYAALRHAGVVQRLLIIVPSAEQLQSYLDEIENDMVRVGAPVSGAYRALNQRSLRLHRLNEAEIFVETIQSLSGQGLPTVLDLMNGGRWMLAADEFHRYADGNTWGEAIKSLTPIFTAAVSATPNRTDCGTKAIEGSADVEISLAEAVEEGAIRRVVTHVMDYTVDMMISGDDTPQRFNLKNMEQTFGLSGKMQNFSQIEVSRDIRYSSKYISESLLNTCAMLNELNNNQPGEHKMIIFALGVRHAQSICDQIKAFAPDLKADWMGTNGTDRASGESIGRSDMENETVLARFKRGELQVLVQVRKAAEGFNDVKCSVLVFLNMLHESVLLQQAVGRGLRRNIKIPEGSDLCHIYVSHDHPGVEFLKALAEELAFPEEQAVIDERRESSDRKGPVIYDIRNFYIVDAKSNGEELYYPLGNSMLPKAAVIEKIRNSVLELQGVSDELIDEKIRALFNVEPEMLSSTERLSNAKRKVQEAVHTLANNVARIRSFPQGGTIAKGLVGDNCKAIHARYKKYNGGTGQGEMTIEELEAKHKWVQKLNSEIKKSDDPLQFVIEEASWLML